MLTSFNTIIRRRRLVDVPRTISTTSTCFSNEGSSDDGDSRKDKAKLKLNSLLQSIIKDESLVKDDPVKQEAAPRPKLKEKRAKERTERNLGERMVKAAKEVAETIEGDKDKNEAQLLGKVVANDEKLQQSVFKAMGKSTLRLLLADLKVEKEKKDLSRSTLTSMRDQQRGTSRAELMASQRTPVPGGPRWSGAGESRSVDVFGGRVLGIFSPTKDYVSGPSLETWEQCASRELRVAFTHPPRNIWEQMVQWTDKGMLWKFPIDNEQGLEKEREVSFVDHVFLELHLEDWCPKRGPIKNFMELVCVGLSRNHWLSAEEKKDHIMWYKEYFLSKKELIKELGAGDFVETSQSSSQQ